MSVTGPGARPIGSYDDVPDHPAPAGSTPARSTVDDPTDANAVDDAKDVAPARAQLAGSGPAEAAARARLAPDDQRRYDRLASSLGAPARTDE